MIMFKNTLKHIDNYQEKLNTRLDKKWYPLAEAFNELQRKIEDNLTSTLNDNEKFLFQNILIIQKTQKECSLNDTEKENLIKANVLSETEDPHDISIFRHKGMKYAANLNIKPTINTLFKELKENRTDLEKIVDFIHHNMKEHCGIYNNSNEKDSYVNIDSPEISTAKGVLWWGYEIGGRDGGNCWGGNAEEYSVSEKPKISFPPLKEFLKAIAPKITFLEYDELASDIKSSVVTEREYYGNATDYHIETIDAKTLYKHLNKMGYLENLASKKDTKNRKTKLK